MVEHSRQPTPRPAPRQAPIQDSAKDADGAERIAKALARAGVASRRDVERLIEAGRVALNGKVLTTPAVKVGPQDILTVDGAVVGSAEPTRLWRYHKPTGLVTTHKDPQGRPTVFEHLPEGLPRVISVGRLDLNSEGLLLLTNDGGLARALELPSSGWVRRYRARAWGHASQAKLDTLKNGITVEGVSYGPIDARLDKVQTRAGERPTEGMSANVWITIALTEGKNREVRRVLEAIGLKVNRLIRLAYGPFALGALEQGAAEEIGPRVIREQLSQFIAPANLPTGDRRTSTLAPAGPQRRGPKSGKARDGGDTGSDGEVRAKRPGPRSAGPRPRSERKAEAAEPREKKVYKAGWAKAKPKPRPAAPANPKPKRRGPAPRKPA
ncbi:MAG TPA: pseudouridine synthase [Caulobacteraceae bacterium]|jgi:23S rRNA pseudouridine2605 synthase|nr:pseudouridine synthase [Caulobacteraceae bacterium]